MIEQIFQKWLKQVLHSPYAGALPLFQKKVVFLNMLETIFSRQDDIYYILPELIDFVERDNLDFRNFLDALFLLRDQIIAGSESGNFSEPEIRQALESLQDIIIKIGSYFTHRQMDLNVRHTNLHVFESERIEANLLQLDENFNIEKANSRLYQNFGYEKDEIVGSPIEQLFSDSSKTLIENALRQLKHNIRFKIDLEVEAQHKNGQKFQALLKISRMHPNNNLSKYTAFIQDNTYIHETKSMLNLLSMALESAGEGIIILEPGPEATIIYANEAMEKLSGYSRNKLLGRPLRILFGQNESAALEKEIISASCQSGWKGEITSQHKKAHHYLVNLHTQPVKDENGDIIAIVGIQQDITQQKARQNKIIHLQKFVEHIINNLQQFVLVTDSQLNIRFWNHSLEKSLNIDAGTAIGKNVLEFLPQFNKLHLDIAAQNVLRTGEIFTKKFFASLTADNENYYQLSLASIYSENEKQLLWTIQDITKEELLKIRITWQNARLKFLENFSQLLNKNLDIKSIFKQFAQELKEILPFRDLFFFLPYNPEKYQFNLFYHFKDGEEDFPQNCILDLSQNSMITELVETAEPQVRNLDPGESWTENIPREIGFSDEIGQIINLPINFEKEVLGILHIGHEEAGYYQKNDIDFLQQIASHLATALKNSLYFNLVTLQNKKLNTINSIFNVPQNIDSLDEIYRHTYHGLTELLDCESAAFYHSADGKKWDKIALNSDKGHLPGQLTFREESAAVRTEYWDKFHEAPPDLQETTSPNTSTSGLFISQKSQSMGHFGFLSTNNHILDQIDPDFMATLAHEVLKQMNIVLDHISLFEKVKRAEEEWETTFNTVKIGLAVVDEKFRLVRTNRTFSELFALDPQIISGKTCADTFCSRHDEKTCFKSDYRCRRGLTQTDEYFDNKINKTISRTFFPIQNEKKQFIGGVFSIYDVTEQRRQEAKIQFLSKFPETNPNIVISIDRSGNLNYMNPAGYKLLKALNLTESNFQNLLPAGLNGVLENFDENKTTFLELDHTFRGRVLQYIIYRPEEDSNFYFYGTDITERVELQRQLLQTERIRAVGEMAAGVAHDFNNLLATILGRTQLLLLKSDNPEIKNELKIVEKAAMDGGQIVSRMQEVTRERRDRNYQPLDVNELIKESIIFTANKLKVSTQLKGKKVQLISDFCENAIVKGDSVELKEVFTNLLLNAYDAMPNGGEFNIRTQILPDNQLQVVFKDTGQGMPEEVRSKIFNPFFTTKGEKGTGLGLSIVYNSITAHSGSIKVESIPNQGTEFIITLPLSDEPIRRKKNDQVKIRKQSEKIRLLIVDDEPELLDTMAEILRLKFKSVEIASGGQLALEKIENQSFDVILTDLGMPEMSGWELSRRVKQKLPDARVVLVTGWGDQAKEELKHHPYVDEILSKPYELRDLMGKIQKFYVNNNNGSSE